MTTTPKHTPLKSKEYNTYDAGKRASLYTTDGSRIAIGLPPDLAAFIVLAVNNHERLLEALRAYQRANPLHNDSEAALYEQGEAAIAAVKVAETPPDQRTTTPP